MASNPGLAKLLAASVFPMGLALIIICGAELFTGNTALLTAAAYEGEAKWRDVLVRWAVVYAGQADGPLVARDCLRDGGSGALHRQHVRHTHGDGAGGARLSGHLPHR
ncbi:hypothetical protein Vretimale_5171 [Volvox reticuliferus]|uniref:Uncharacterized protein n=1 Tax=Volvox reticuliferus TaxID=1737510 RepID=A0A8J4LJV2_9CHLO|nr:hypothetical protein Vretifemale_3710 [Volvox reticuliferus]GIM00404.1 hypothetical protein Vretimale_5171 [Volvox reticuliferus]